MIQRIQSLYIFISIVLMAIVATSPLMTITLNNCTCSLKAWGIANGEQTILSTIPLLILAIAIFVFDGIALASFKKRFLQIRFLIFAIVLKLGFYGLMAYYVFQAKDTETLMAEYNLPITFPLISAILAYLAIRSILKDEALVKSLDRIR